MKNVKPPSKKTKGKGKSAAAEPSEVDESQVGDALSEVKIRPLFTRHPFTVNLCIYISPSPCNRMKTTKARRTLLR